MKTKYYTGNGDYKGIGDDVTPQNSPEYVDPTEYNDVAYDPLDPSTWITGYQTPSPGTVIGGNVGAGAAGGTTTSKVKQAVDKFASAFSSDIQGLFSGAAARISPTAPSTSFMSTKILGFPAPIFLVGGAAAIYWLFKHKRK